MPALQARRCCKWIFLSPGPCSLSCLAFASMVHPNSLMSCAWKHVELLWEERGVSLLSGEKFQPWLQLHHYCPNTQELLALRQLLHRRGGRGGNWEVSGVLRTGVVPVRYSGGAGSVHLENNEHNLAICFKSPRVEHHLLSWALALLCSLLKMK